MLLNFLFVSVFSTYFIEYQFPVVATSRDKYSPNAMATEVMRVVSRNEKSGGQCINRKQVPYSKYSVALGLHVGCVLHFLIVLSRNFVPFQTFQTFADMRNPLCTFSQSSVKIDLTDDKSVWLQLNPMCIT